MISLRFLRLFETRAKEIKEAVVGTANEISKDAQKTASTFKSAVQQDMKSIAHSVGDSSNSNKAQNKVKGTYEASKDTMESSKDTIVEKIENVTESVVGKVKDTINSVKETVTGGIKASQPKPDDSMKTAALNPMGQSPDRPQQTEPQEPLNKATKELQKKGAKSKAEEDSFNLM